MGMMIPAEKVYLNKDKPEVVNMITIPPCGESWDEVHDNVKEEQQQKDKQKAERGCQQLEKKSARLR